MVDYEENKYQISWEQASSFLFVPTTPSLKQQSMDLSFHVNLTCGKLSEVEYKTTTHEVAIAKYSADVERQNKLKEGTLKDVITRAVPYKPCIERMAIFSHVVCHLRPDASERQEASEADSFDGSNWPLRGVAALSPA
jgi:hypothetical protein